MDRSRCQHRPRRPRRAISLLLIAGWSAAACADPPDAADNKAGLVDADGADVTASDVIDVLHGDGVGCSHDLDCPASLDPCRPNRCGPGGLCVSVAVQHGGCHDGDPCTIGDSCKAGVCSPGPNGCQCDEDKDCANFEDGDACNGTLVCHKGVVPHTCVVNQATVVTCSGAKDTPCASNACDPTSGECVAVPAVDGKPCVDDDPCTVDSACKGGKCAATATSKSWCKCQADADCAAFDDDDLCTGVLYCDTASFPYSCRVNPASVVKCLVKETAPCTANLCVPTTGKCEVGPLPDGELCDDGDPCTGSEICTGGECVAGTDACSCAKDKDCEVQEDGNLCNGTLYCDIVSAKCVVNPKTVITCPTFDDTMCSKKLCNPTTGTCSPTAVKNGVACDDSDACTTGDICLQGSCAAGTNTCLCKSDSDCAGKDDGNLCNGLPFCNLQTGTCDVNPASIVVCPSVDDTVCAKNACGPKDGKCAVAPVADLLKLCEPVKTLGDKPQCRYEVAPQGAGKGGDVLCDDGDVCTAGDTCAAGKCTPGTFICGCKSDVDCVAKDDGDLCNGVLYCDKTAAVPLCKLNKGSVVTCPTVDDTACLKNICQPKTGKCALLLLASGTPCDDGNGCTKADACLAGKCAGPNTCECQVSADCAEKEDGNACNGTLYCDKSGAAPKCAINPASVVVCPQYVGSTCLAHVCNPSNGQCLPAPANQGVKCDDGTACTALDACDTGACAGKAVDCDDGNPCTKDTCDANAGCAHALANCDDGNDCTADQCDAKTGQCAFDEVTKHANTCNADDDGCTINDTCDLGTCKAGQALTCTIPLLACQQAACLSTGAKTFQCMVVPADDGHVCEDSDVCKLGATCQAGSCKTGAKDRLFTRLVAAPKGHLTLSAVSPVVGGFVAVGATSAAPLVDAKSLSWAVTRVDAAGERMWDVALPVPVADPGAVARSVVGLDDGSVVVAGATRLQQNTALDGQVVRLSASGKNVVWKTTLGKPGVVKDSLDAVVALADGDLVAAGWQDDGETSKGWLVRLNELGKVVGQWQHASTDGNAAAFTALLPRLDGGFALAGWRRNKAKALLGWWLSVDSQGDKTGTKDFPGGDGQRFDAIATDDAGYLLAGWRQEGAHRRALVVRTDAAGNEVWQHVSTGVDQAFAVASAGGGPVLLAGRSGSSDDTTKLWLRGLDADGLGLWDATQNLGMVEALSALRLTPDGALVAVGTARVDGVDQGVLMRLDAWGHASCKSAGKCAALTAAQCHDDNPCTDDYCVAKSGCVHANNANTCSDGDKCTKDDLCKLAKCVSGAVLACADGNSCTLDSCAPKSGCVFQPTPGACDDGEPCTTGTVCNAGVCKGEAKVCDDGDFCTADSCVSGKGCAFVPAGAKVCDDGNQCTMDSCADGSKKSKDTACVHANVDGLSCEDGDKCTLGEVCSAGKCAKGGPRYFISINAEGMCAKDCNVREPMPRATVRTADGGMAVAARWGSGKGSKSWARPVLFRFGPLGDVKWTRAVESEGFHGNPQHIVGLRGLADGDFALVARGAHSNDNEGPTAFGLHGRIDALGKIVWQRTYGGLSGSALYDLEVGQAGVQYCLGESGKHDDTSTWLMATDSSGNPLWTRTHREGPPERGVALSVLGDGSIIAVSHSSTGQIVRRLNGVGDENWRTRPPMGGSGLLLDAKGILLAGSQCQGASCQGAVTRMTLGGEVLWTRSFAAGLSTWLRTIISAGDGLAAVGTVLVQKQGNYHTYACRVVKLDSAGNEKWSRLFEQPQSYWGQDPHTRGACVAAVSAPDGSVVVVGSTGNPYGALKTWSLSPWGHASCQEAGECAQLVSSDCQDGDVCTDDLCEPAKGCAPKNNTGDCDDGNPCTLNGACKDGSCKPGPARYWDVTIGSNLDDRATALATTADGGFWVLGGSPVPGVNQTDGGKSGSVIAARLALVDVAGTVVKTTLQHATEWVAGAGGKQLRKDYGTVPIDLHTTRDGGALATASLASLQPEGAWPSIRGAAVTVAVDANEKVGAPKLSGVPYYTDEGIETSAPLPGGVVLLAGAQGSGSGARLVWRTVAGDGTPLLHSADYDNTLVTAVALPAGYSTFRPVAAVATTAHDVLLIGHARAAAAARDDVWLGRFDPVKTSAKTGGKFLAQEVHAGAGSRTLSDVARSPAGGWLVGGMSVAHGAGNWDGWLARVDVGLQLTASRHFGGAGLDAVHGVRLAPAGGWLAWGRTASSGAGKVDGWLIAVDDSLQPLWQRTYGGKEDDDLVDVAVLTGGELALLGNTRSKGAGGQDIWLIRGDPWGRLSCAEAGGCVKENVVSCDDQDPCTADTCHKDKGCTHTASPTACAEHASCPVAPGWKDPPSQQRQQFDALFGKPGVSDEAAAALDLGDGRVQAVGHRWEAAAKLRDGWMVQTDAAGQVLWERAWGGDLDDRLEAVVAHPAGGTLAAGRTASAQLGNAGGEDGWLVRVADDGMLLWTRTYGGAEDDGLWGLTVAKDGSMVAVGRSKTQSAGSFDGWVVRADANGAPLWQQRVGGKGIDYLYAVTSMGQDSVAVGTSKSAAPPGTDKDYAEKGGFDLWLVRLDAAGNTVWDRRFGTDKDDGGRALLRLTDGFAVAGGSLGYGFGDAVLWRLDNNGGPLWQRSFGGPNLADEAVSLAALPGGGFALGGHTASKGAGKQDGWLVVTDADGKQRWDRTIGTAADERLTAIAPLRHGGFALAGVRDKPDGEAWILRTNPWGYADCKAAGKCAHNGPAQCDDGVACTADGCDVATGCSHAPIPGAGDCPPQNTQQTAGASCAALLKANPGAQSGAWWVDPKGDWKGGPVLVGCDMVTDGGGWMLAMALRADTAESFAAWMVANASGVAGLPGQLRGDVTDSGWLHPDFALATVAASQREVLLDIGAGLFRHRFTEATAKILTGGLSPYRLLQTASVWESSVKWELHEHALGVHLPAAQVPWVSAADIQPGEACAKSTKTAKNCPYMPANLSGPYQTMHSEFGEPAAGYDGAAPHHSKVLLR